MVRLENQSAAERERECIEEENKQQKKKKTKQKKIHHRQIGGRQNHFGQTPNVNPSGYRTVWYLLYAATTHSSLQR